MEHFLSFRSILLRFVMRHRLFDEIYTNGACNQQYACQHQHVHLMPPDEVEQSSSDKGEVLYSISVSADESVADFFPAYSGNHSVSSIFDYYIKTSNSENVTILGGTGAFALADDMIQTQRRVNALECCGFVVVDGELCVKYTKPTT